MKVTKGTPPNFEAIKAALPGADKGGVIFTYGDTIYLTGDASLTAELRDHEAVHVEQQANYPGGPEAWWEKYLADPAFRLSQELPAHRVEYQSSPERDRNQRAMALHVIASRLSGPLYGKLMTFREALRAIRSGGH